MLSTWAMGDELDAFLQAGEAEVNLVVSSVGLRAAKVLEEKFGTPYVVGTPIGSYTERIAKALEEKEQIPYRKDRMQGEIEEIMEQKGNRNPASGEEIKKPEAESDSDRRTGDHGISGSRDRTEIWLSGGSSLPAGKNRRSALQTGQMDLWGRRNGRSIERCRNHCSGSIVSANLSEVLYVL